jgi:hypothetical protein
VLARDETTSGTQKTGIRVKIQAARNGVEFKPAEAPRKHMEYKLLFAVFSVAIYHAWILTKCHASMSSIKMILITPEIQLP